jgi:hypothetical protein
VKRGRGCRVQAQKGAKPNPPKYRRWTKAPTPHIPLEGLSIFRIIKGLFVFSIEDPPWEAKKLPQDSSAGSLNASLL